MDLFLLWIAALGAVIGSFLNVVILRFEKEEAITGRSACPHCASKLQWYELIPIVSYLVQQGRCRTCGTHISLQYPLVESATAVLFVLVTTHFGGMEAVVQSLASLTAFVLHLALWALLMVITVYDLRTKLIPDIFSYTFAGLAFVSMFIGTGSLMLPIAWDIVAGPLFFLPFYLLWKVSDGRWIGLGDGKLALGFGWFLGLSQGVAALLLAFWVGAALSILLIGVQKLALRLERQHTLPFIHTGKTLSMKSEIPFGPFLVLGCVLSYFFSLGAYDVMLL